MDAAIATHQLTRRFGRLVAVDQVTLTVPAGSIFGLIGSNGAGKTTLIRLLCGLQEPTSGQAEVLGMDIVASREAIRRRLGYMSQAFSLYGDLSVDENLRFYSRLYGAGSSLRLDATCDRIGLNSEDRKMPVARLATGIRQRAALAAAVLHRPELVFLDEPTSGVDPAGRRDFWALIHGLAAEGMTVVVTTHVIAEAERCDQVALMAGGKVLGVGSPARLRAQADLEVFLIQARPWQRAYAALKARWPATSLRGTLVRVALPGGAGGTLDFAAQLPGVEIEAVTAEQPTLEDVFVRALRS